MALAHPQNKKERVDLNCCSHYEPSTSIAAKSRARVFCGHMLAKLQGEGDVKVLDKYWLAAVLTKKLATHP